MMFCPKCGSLLKTRTGKKGEPEYFCSCGYSSAVKEEKTIKEAMESTEEIAVIEDQNNVHPLTDTVCPKCEHNKAWYWMQQTRSGDEPETKFFKCEKCRHVWRDYD
jgi:transcription factor S